MVSMNIKYISEKFYNFSASSIKKINSDYKKSAVMCLFFENDNKVYILLTKRSEKLKNHAGEICFPGGRIEKNDKDPLDTALRETFEEVGVSRDKIKVIGQLDDYITGTGFHISTFVGILKPKQKLLMNKNEVSEIIYLPLDVLKNKKNFIWYCKKFGNKEYKFWKINYIDYNIWGATASIIVSLASKIFINK